jgi:hypothetical protein
MPSPTDDAGFHATDAPLAKLSYSRVSLLVLRYFEWVDQPVITDEPCIHGKKQTKNSHQELRKRGEVQYTN